MRAMRNLFVVLMALTLALAGCGSNTATTKDAVTRPEGQSPQAPDVKKPLESVSVKLAMGGSKGSILYLPPVFAEQAGLFKDEAIDIELLEFQGGAQAQQALVSGQVDFATMAQEHAVKAKAEGVELVMLAIFWRYPTVALVVDSKYKDQVKTAKDLKGMKIGITSPGSGSHKVLLSILSQAGLSPSDVEIIGTGMPGMPDALAKGQIQAAANYDPYVTKVVNNGQAYLLVDTRTKKDTEALYGGEYPFVGLVTRRDVLESKPELVERVVAAVVRANMFITTNPAEATAAKLSTPVTGSDVNLYVAALKANLEAFSPDGQASEKGIQIVIQSLKQDNVIPANADIKPAEVFDGSFARKAMK